MKNVGTKLIILDRDGTIIKLIDYLRDESLVELLPEVGTSLNLLAELGFDFAIATNQSVVGRGLATVSQVESVNRRVEKLLLDYDVSIKKIVFCPHHPEMNCKCRKPKPAMGLEIINSLGFKFEDTVVIGDQETDLEFAKNLGVKSIYFSKIKPKSINSEIYCSDWKKLPEMILNLLTI